MPNSEEFDNFDPFPLGSQLLSADQKGREEVPSEESEAIVRRFTPVHAMRVEYRHQSEIQSPWKTLNKPSRIPYSQRADQLGIFWLVGTLVLLTMLWLIFHISKQRHLYARIKPPVTSSTAVVDFYLGNYTFSMKEAEARAEKELLKTPNLQSLPLANSDLQVPLSEQMSSMDAKIDLMRTEKNSGETPPPPPDTGAVPEFTKHRDPIRTENFQNPQKLNAALPKVLQTAQ